MVDPMLAQMVRVANGCYFRLGLGLSLLKLGIHLALIMDSNQIVGRADDM